MGDLFTLKVQSSSGKQGESRKQGTKSFVNNITVCCESPLMILICTQHQLPANSRISYTSNLLSKISWLTVSNAFFQIKENCQINLLVINIFIPKLRAVN